MGDCLDLLSLSWGVCLGVGDCLGMGDRLVGSGGRSSWSVRHGGRLSRGGFDVVGVGDRLGVGEIFLFLEWETTV